MSKMKSEDYPAAYYEGGVGSEYNGYGDDPGWAPIADVALLYSPNKMAPTLYDLGCAKGFFVSAARKIGFDAYGIDISEYAVASAPSHIAPYVRVGNVVDLPWGDDTADVVHTGEFLEHIYTDELDRVMDEVQRVLKPGGLFINRIGIIPPDDHPFRTGGVVDHSVHLTHFTVWTREQWIDYFTKRGLVHVPEAEAMLDDLFRNRDWVMRFFVWRMPDDQAGGSNAEGG